MGCSTQSQGWETTLWSSNLFGRHGCWNSWRNFERLLSKERHWCFHWFSQITPISPWRSDFLYPFDVNYMISPFRLQYGRYLQNLFRPQDTISVLELNEWMSSSDQVLKGDSIKHLLQEHSTVSRTEKLVHLSMSNSQWLHWPLSVHLLPSRSLRKVW